MFKKSFMTAVKQGLVGVFVLGCISGCTLYNRDQDLHTVTITSNWPESRLLAHAIQYENNQPFILLPHERDRRIFWIPPRSKGPAVEISAQEFTRRLKLVNPETILLLGDERYVPEKYVDMIHPNQRHKVVRVAESDWLKTAAKSEDVLDLNNVAFNFERFYKAKTNKDAYDPNDGDVVVIGDANPMGISILEIENPDLVVPEKPVKVEPPVTITEIPSVQKPTPVQIEVVVPEVEEVPELPIVPK